MNLMTLRARLAMIRRIREASPTKAAVRSGGATVGGQTDGAQSGKRRLYRALPPAALIMRLATSAPAFWFWPVTRRPSTATWFAKKS